MIDPLEMLWPSAETREPLLMAEAIARWPPTAFDRLRTAGFLRPAEGRAYVLCPNCDRRHYTEVLARPGPDGQMRTYVVCNEALRVEVPTVDLQSWAIDFGRLAGDLAEALSLAGRGGALVPQRLWRLGRTKWQDVSREVLFGRGLGWTDAAQVATHIVTLHRPILLIGGDRPPLELWRGRIPAIVSLPGMVSMREGSLSFDLQDMAAAVREADELARQAAEHSIDLRQLKRIVRRQVAAERTTQLTDDVLVAAYHQCNSLREAAKMLSQATGQVIGKDRIAGAIRRRGGMAAMARTTSSSSVRRAVVSHRRDS